MPQVCIVCQEKRKNSLVLCCGWRVCFDVAMIATLETKPMTAYDQLNARQRLFVDHYLACHNGAEAARQAGYSVLSANRIAAENMSKPLIKQALEERIKAIGVDKSLTPERIRSKIADIAFDDEQKPEVQLKALELVGKATPGTFDQPTQQPSTVNLLAILANLGITHPPARANVPVATSVITTSSVESVTAQTISPSGEGSSTPHEGSVSENTPTQKFVDQK